MQAEFMYLVITTIVYIFCLSIDISLCKYIDDLEYEQFISLCKKDEEIVIEKDPFDDILDF